MLVHLKILYLLHYKCRVAKKAYGGQCFPTMMSVDAVCRGGRLRQHKSRYTQSQIIFALFWKQQFLGYIPPCKRKIRNKKCKKYTCIEFKVPLKGNFITIYETPFACVFYIYLIDNDSSFPENSCSIGLNDQPTHSLHTDMDTLYI